MKQTDNKQILFGGFLLLFFELSHASDSQTCSQGKHQSPIDISDATPSSSLGEIGTLHYDRTLGPGILMNSGRGLKFTMEPDKKNVPSLVMGGGLYGNVSFQFLEMNVHWGSQKSGRGSEHSVEGKFYPMELHLVHVNKKYKDLDEAITQSDGLAILSLLFRLSKEDNEHLQWLIQSLEHLQSSGSNLTVPHLPPFGELLPDGRIGAYFRYEGSLTIPPCSESVIWTLGKAVSRISEGQLESLRRLENENGIGDNFRKTQPKNGRKILEYTPSPPGSDPSSSSYDVYQKEPEEIDHFFLLIMSIIIFFMQCGFAFMEAGAVRSKNTVNILIKNWLDICIGAMTYWAVGFAFTFGKSADPISGQFIGSSYFFFYDMPYYKLSKWFFQFVFAATAATLVSGSLAERCNFVAYVVYSIMITGFIYPILAHWTWHREGWLRTHGFFDFAGSGVVHLTGAVCALVGCVLMGPRAGRFNKEGQPNAMPGHSVPLSALGGLILVFGFFACNGTKQGSISNPGDGTVIARAIVNTALGTSSAGICTLVFYKMGVVPGSGKNYSFLITMNGSLTGTVALCAGCNVFPCWGAVVVGGLSGPLFVIFDWLLLHLKIDDPLAAIPVHGVGGVWGILSVFIFKEDGILLTGSKEAFLGFCWNLIGLLAIVVWTFTCCFIMFFTLKKMKLLRVEPAYEFKGMDILKHGESAYPADAWVEQQYMNGESRAEELCGGGMAVVEGERSRKSSSSTGLPPNMRFSRQASYNDPHRMFPSASKLFGGMNSIAGTVHATEKKIELDTIGEIQNADEKENNIS